MFHRVQRRSAAGVVLYGLSILTIQAAPRTAQRRPAVVTALERWVDRVNAHVPGERDEALEQTAGLLPVERLDLLNGVDPFIDAVTGISRPSGTSAALKDVAKKIHDPFDRWLKRAVILETDAALLAPELTADAMKTARGMAEAIHAEDGELAERNMLNWHWEFARQLLDYRRSLDVDRFGVAWYHATAVRFLGDFWLAELGPHLRKGMMAFHDNPRLEFDKGALYDAFASTRVQAVLLSESRPSLKPEVPSETSAEETAMRAYTRALELDPSFQEARVRLARLTEKKGNAQEALSLCATVLANTIDAPTSFMAHLTAARALQRLGRLREAASHADAALTLFPTAQSAHLAASAIALDMGDVGGAKALAAKLEALGDHADRSDPWWTYYQLPWFDASGLIDRLRAEVK